MATAAEQVRTKIGERIPTGGKDSDTMFSNQEIADFLTEGNNDVNAAAYYGWQAKAAEWARLVTVNEGNAAREMTELHRHALRMMDRFIGYIPTPGRGRARIGTIVRETD